MSDQNLFCFAGCVTCSTNVQVGDFVRHFVRLLYLMLSGEVWKVLCLSQSYTSDSFTISHFISYFISYTFLWFVPSFFAIVSSSGHEGLVILHLMSGGPVAEG